ncbi:hypothetical protein ALC62_02872 [Cyphomyrmex costatus]|uniref:BESS domain-containing protein n=1 Tax=Cyphomyrmex costatus TaxID=456900 RepID=A0A151IML3_9HYME|nr:hypothetical protein ALC62_02872 [Cyphomyrmex costatus]
MKFLNDVFDTRQTISSLSNDITENEIYTTPEQHENDIVASSSGFTDISLRTPTIIHASSSMLTPTRVQTPTQTSVTPRTTTSNNVLLQSSTLSVTSRIPASNSRKQKSDALQIALIEALEEPPTQATDPLDGFLAQLGEGMRRLPYRDRARLEIQFLTLLAEKDFYAHNNPNTELPTRY